MWPRRRTALRRSVVPAPWTASRAPPVAAHAPPMNAHAADARSADRWTAPILAIAIGMLALASSAVAATPISRWHQCPSSAYAGNTQIVLTGRCGMARVWSVGSRSRQGATISGDATHGIQTPPSHRRDARSGDGEVGSYADRGTHRSAYGPQLSHPARARPDAGQRF